MKEVIIKVIILCLFSTACQNRSSNLNDQDEGMPSLLHEGTTLEFHYDTVTGIGYELGCTRRDPSDVLKVGDTWYVWYTKVYGRSEGYWGTIWYATSTDSGYTWIKQGESLGRGEEGAFDSQATFTPNILVIRDKYYLFYTGVKPTPGRTDGVFENNSSTDITAIGVAVSDSPHGPFKRISPEPGLMISEDYSDFDSYRVDDASLLHFNGKFWLYYKGRSKAHGVKGPELTRMGVAFADNPAGPYKKYGEPILPESHEVFIWPYQSGVVALASISSTIEYAPDGIAFLSNKLGKKVRNRPNAPGVFRPDLTGHNDSYTKLQWGISMIHNGNESYLIRFKCEIKNQTSDQ